jgi:hypothetical protein
MGKAILPSGAFKIGTRIVASVNRPTVSAERQSGDDSTLQGTLLCIELREKKNRY